MPVKLFGKTTDFKGKTLWQILGNLKDFGVGRIVGRQMFQRYPEPSYYKIVKVEALPNDVPNESYEKKRKVIALCENHFRGIKQEKLVQMESSTYKSDYFLVPKHEEKKFTEIVRNPTLKVLPSKMQVPPLLKEVYMQQKNYKNSCEEPTIKVCYNLTGIKTYRVAEEEEEIAKEKPIEMGVGKTIAPRLYENLQS